MSEENDLRVTREFEESILKYVEVDDKIKDAEKTLKELKSQRKTFEDSVIKSLTDLGEDVIELTSGKIKKSRKESKKAVNKDIIKDALAEKIDDPTIVADILNTIEQNRPTQVKVTLRRTTRSRKVARKKLKKNT